MNISDAKINLQINVMATSHAQNEKSNILSPNWHRESEAVKITISDEGKMLSQSLITKEEKEAELKKNATHNEQSIYYSDLFGKLENTSEIAKQLEEMLFSKGISNIETRAQNREEARALAGHIAENYFDDPNEAKSFMNKINNEISRLEKFDMVKEQISFSEERAKSAGRNGTTIEQELFIRENYANMLQSLIDNVKAQAKNTPVKDLLAKHNISVKVA